MIVGVARAERDGVSAMRGARLALRRAWTAALALVVVCSLGAGASRADALEALTIATSSGAHAFVVEIAASEAAREKGLMGRRFLPADRGMLFEFDRAAPVAFWMKNTYIALDMMFIARDGSVTRIVADAEPLSQAVIPSGGPCAAVLELNAGVAARIGAKVGDRVSHPFFKR